MNYDLVSERNFEEESCGDIAFLITGAYKAGQQLPREHLSFLQNLLNFIITKYLKKEVDDELSVCVDEPPMGRCPINFYHSCFYCLNFDSSSSFIIQLEI